MPLVTYTDIANMALGYVGGGVLNNLETDATEDANLARRYFDVSRKAELETYDWSFARRFQVLPAASDEPQEPWSFAYVLPADVLAVRGIQRVRGSAPDRRIAYELAASADGNQALVLTDQPDAVLRYTFDQENTAVYTTNFVLALAHRLASYVGYSRTRKLNIMEAQLGLAAQARAVAQGADANAGQVEKPEPAAPWTLDRDRGAVEHSTGRQGWRAYPDALN